MIFEGGLGDVHFEGEGVFLDFLGSIVVVVRGKKLKFLLLLWASLPLLSLRLLRPSRVVIGCLNCWASLSSLSRA